MKVCRTTAVAEINGVTDNRTRKEVPAPIRDNATEMTEQHLADSNHKTRHMSEISVCEGQPPVVSTVNHSLKSVEIRVPLAIKECLGNPN